MLAKGHHFPYVTLVVVINADQGLFNADFRGLENRPITNTGGSRAGRAQNPGQVLIQPLIPSIQPCQTLIKNGYGVFAQEQLQLRQQLGLLPYEALALLKAESTQSELAQNLLTQTKEQLQQINELQIIGLTANLKSLKGAIEPLFY